MRRHALERLERQGVLARYRTLVPQQLERCGFPVHRLKKRLGTGPADFPHARRKRPPANAEVDRPKRRRMERDIEKDCFDEPSRRLVVPEVDSLGRFDLHVL